MKIAQIAPLYESVPPQCYGGTERVVSFLTEELVRQGHDVTLFASGDSRTNAKLVAGCPRALRLDERCVDTLAHHLVLLERVFKEASRFDLIHFHCDYLHFPWSRRHPCCHVTTLHGRLNIPDLEPLYREFAGEPVVSISDSQRRPLASANWQGTVYHGLPDDLYRLHDKPGQYLAFLGRISPEKRVDRAIRIAQSVGMKLKIAAKVDAADRSYFDEQIEPLLKKHRSLVEFIGEIGDDAKDEFLGNAHALLFPIDWPEPFGLVMIESMACGTPVIAYRNGSVPEVIEDGVTGLIVENTEQAVRAVERVASLSRAECRRGFERRFSVRRMADEYLSIYRRLMEQDGLRSEDRRFKQTAMLLSDGRAAAESNGNGLANSGKSAPRLSTGQTNGLERREDPRRSRIKTSRRE
jgi:glycosyltransferase involved in cell wall biosynthesis